MGVSVLAPVAQSFCGFYVARADAKLFNQSSQVVLVRDGNRTVITMASDYQGDPEEFALVVPVPTFLEREQIHIGDQALIDHLDAFSGPRLVEYFDDDPCIVRQEFMMQDRAASAPSGAMEKESERYRGVTVEATYTVGEYDILILSAKESGGLANWLTDNGYKIPAGAQEVLSSYIKQDMRFFVAKVNLKEKAALGFSHLRPIQVAYESAKFMLPLRLGTVNASGPQDLILYAITPNGRVEPTNYRSVRVPSGIDLPEIIADDFPAFYKALFDHQVEKEGMRAVFTEYAWNMSWCDPCASDPLSPQELAELGVFWLEQDNRLRPRQTSGTFLTRMHVRYDRDHFPEDLLLQETGDQQTFQARYVMRHPWRGAPVCAAAREYLNQLKVRKQQEAQALAELTGWNLDEIRGKMNIDQYQPVTDPEPWWRRLWKN
ncbi:MAG: DUF2330 domain-containing protein [Candidatus Eisenbacteria bacterium]|uniref:DUF2330 domain-containing protein n=1 Tax=Eiseniibacteriota bacterium TaxID=2212470 RepID=A0A956RR51_UNCEI|nr:DUF2330 domain-containing protein [Candidatus Eisenbacteria bacterium]